VKTKTQSIEDVVVVGVGKNGLTAPIWSPFVDAGRYVRDTIERDLWEWLCAPTIFESEKLIREVNVNRQKRIQEALVAGGAKSAVAKVAAAKCGLLGQLLTESRNYIGYSEKVTTWDSARAEARQHGDGVAAALKSLVVALGKSPDDLPPYSIGQTLLDPAYPPEEPRKRGKPAGKIKWALYRELARQWTETTGKETVVARAGESKKLTAFGRFLYVCVSDSDVDSDDSVSKFVLGLSRLKNRIH
jgi:hypothetical protein